MKHRNKLKQQLKIRQRQREKDRFYNYPEGFDDQILCFSPGRLFLDEEIVSLYPSFRRDPLGARISFPL